MAHRGLITTNEWNMGGDYFTLVAAQIAKCLDAQTAAKEDTTLYDEWYDELDKLDTLIGCAFTKKGQKAEREAYADKAEEMMGINKTYNFNLNLQGNAKKRYEIHKTLLRWQKWLLASAYTNNLLIKTSQIDPDMPVSGV